MESRRRFTIRLWAGFDLVVTGLLVLPPLASAFLGVLLDINGFLGGENAMAGFPGPGLMFACITGALGVLWAITRLLWPSRWLGAIDAVARLWVGGLILYFVVGEGVPAVFLLFVVSEWAGGIHQGVVLLQTNDRPAEPGQSPMP